ncbi:FMN-binding negative transcriptional regulator [Streptomyces sp. NPDC127049]|uniref:FMN-binding negative transcriptional regulator n=1 Tax=Streptomyces sp. NPDC127049 TaxID=3347118 RepID=UPI003669D03C
MYVPDLYRAQETALHHEVIEGHPFGMLTAVVDGRIHGTHIPFVLDKEPEHGPNGRLRGHLSRTNPVVAALRAGEEMMVAFVGPHSYIRPDDYASEPHFPTWNYAAVHAYGRPRVMEGEEELRQLADLIAHEEARFLPKEPWTLDRAPGELVEGFRSGIVAFELPLDRLDGIVKFGQNKEPEDVRAQISSFRARAAEAAAAASAVADRMESHNAERLSFQPPLQPSIQPPSQPSTRKAH